jgi:calcium/calmodulin-dependent protein kinase I
MCGTPGYVAPEILERILGVIVYIFLGGYCPFEEKSQHALFARIRVSDYTFHEEFWHTVSANGKDLIRSLLQHSWMTVSEDVLASTDLIVNLHELKRFNAKRKFEVAVKTVIVTQKLTSMFQQVCEREIHVFFPVVHHILRSVFSYSHNQLEPSSILSLPIYSNLI